MTGDCNGRWGGEYSWPERHDAYLDNAKDAILTLRHHPSLAFWCFGNELYPKTESPPYDIREGLEDSMRRLDPNRWFVASSMSNYTDYDPSYALSPRDGPYGILLPSDFFERNPGLTFENGTRADRLSISFQPEIGSVSMPTVESLRRFLSPSGLRNFPKERDDGMLQDEWEFHDYLPFTTPKDAWRTELRAPYDHVYGYGVPRTIEDYAAAATAVQITQYQSLFEGFQFYMWEYYSAVVLWKSQSPWPTMRGALYDYWLCPTGGFYGVKRALGKHIGVILNVKEWTLAVVNKGNIALRCEEHQKFAVRVSIVSLRGETISTHVFELEQRYRRVLPEQSVAKVVGHVPWPDGRNTNEVVLVRALLLKFDVNGKSHHDDPPLASSEYWQSNPIFPPNYELLGQLHQDKTRWGDISVHVTDATTPTNNPKRCILHMELKLDPISSHIAFFVRAQLMYGQSQREIIDRRILPVWWSDNYLQLLPGETKMLIAEYETDFWKQPTGIEVHIDGWNVNPVIVSVSGS